MLTYNEVINKITKCKDSHVIVEITEELADTLASEGYDLCKQNNNYFHIYTEKRVLEYPEELSLDNLKDQYNLWISPFGKIYTVFNCGHFTAALALGSYSDTRHEKKGWLHISDNYIQNYYKVKMTDKQYEVVYLWAEVNNRLYHLNNFIRDNEQK